jgi:hypothetical protein
MSFKQHCFICRPSDSPVSEDAGIEPRTLATLALAVRRAWLDLDYIFHSNIFLEDFFPLHFPTFLSPVVADKQGPSIDEGKK